MLLSERSRRNALAQEPETSWIPECGALQESPESPTWTGSRFPWQRRTNRRKHWGNPVILQHWTIINTQSGEGSRSWYSSNPYRALGRGTSYQNHCWSWCGCMFLNRKGVCAQLLCRSLKFLNVYRVLFRLLSTSFDWRKLFFLLWLLEDGNFFFFIRSFFFSFDIFFFYLFFTIFLQMFRETWRLAQYHTMRSMDQGTAEVLWLSGNQPIWFSIDRVVFAQQCLSL